MSAKFKPAALTRTSTCPLLGTGSGRSSIFRAPTSPLRVVTIARMKKVGGAARKHYQGILSPASRTGVFQRGFMEHDFCSSEQGQSHLECVSVFDQFNQEEINP